jgi:Tol biopolymer transport system component
LFEELKGDAFSLWTLSLRDRMVQRFGDIESPESIDAAFSPDGRWVVYDAVEESGGARVYVEPFPRTGTRYRVSDAGVNAFWSPDGKELVYAPAPSQFFAVTFSTHPTVEFGTPRPVPRGGLGAAFRGARRNYDPSPDGKHILGVLDGAGQQRASTVQVVLQWFDELKARAPVK